MGNVVRDLLTKFWELIFKSSPSVVKGLTSITMVLYWVLVAWVVMKLIKLLVLRSNKHKAKKNFKETKEQITVMRLLNNVLRAFFIFWIAIMILTELGIDIMPLIAGAGVLAFAVGFGAQEVVKDLIGGIFLIFEKTLTIGDYVEINGQKGTVTNVGLRRLELINWKKEVITMNNGDIKTVINYSLNHSVAEIEFLVDVKFDIRELYTKKFINFMNEFAEENEYALENPSLPVLLSMTDSLKFRVTIDTVTRKNAGVEREFRKALVNYFNDNKLSIEIPVIVEQR